MGDHVLQGVGGGWGELCPPGGWGGGRENRFFQGTGGGGGGRGEYHVLHGET